ncbi:MAG: hypothetical protein R3B39_01400 [Candidatus Paceibacterota bacterium]
MKKDILKITKWKKTNEELLEFIASKKVRSGDDIRNWIALCVVYFTEVGVPENIINYFLSKLEYYREKAGKKDDYYGVVSGYELGDQEELMYNFNVGIGPFIFDNIRNGYIVSNKIKINRLLSGLKQVDNTKMTPILVSFKVAENIIENYEDEERVIPKVLLEQFDTEKNQGIHLSLESIQNSYEDRDAKKMLSSVITATDLVFGLIPELKAGDKISKKINKIFSDNNICEKYSINLEILWGLNNSRIIRNYDSHKPKKENHTTLYEAVSYCHLLVLFTCSILASGNIEL